MFSLLGDTPEQAATEAKNVMTIETALAQGSMSRVDRRTPANVYHIITIAALQALTPDFDWKTFLNANQQGGLKTVNVIAPGFFKAMNEQLDSADINALKSYMRWHTVHRFAANLSEPFVQENFKF